MKKIFSILMIALFAIAMVACKKDNPKPDDNNGGNNGGNNDTPTLVDNVLIYDGVTYTGEASASISNGMIQYALQKMDGENGSFFVQGSYKGVDNCTFNLTEVVEGVEFYVHVLIGEGIFDMQYTADTEHGLWSFVDGDNTPGISSFTSGTATVTKNGDNLTIVMDGVVRNGKSLKCKLVTAINSGR